MAAAAMTAVPGAAAAATSPSAESAQASQPSAAPKAGKLNVSFTTKTYGGKYAPVNLGAVWIEDSAGKWVYTLEMWCGWQNTKSLMPYNAAGGVDYSVGLFPGSNTTMPPSDVITAATQRQHKQHSGASWSFKDKDGKEVPDGMYKLKLEITEQEDAGKIVEVPIMKGAPAGLVMATDGPGFTNLKIELQ
jgi:hypothetical protein